MNAKQLQRSMWAIAAALVIFVLARRWRTMMDTAWSNPQRAHTDSITVPLPSTSGTASTAPEDASEEDENEPEEEPGSGQTRKVSRDRRIKYHGQRYGPLPETLVGERVSVEEVDDQLHVSFGDQVVATFHLHAS
jgi:hypothetical protein